MYSSILNNSTMSTGTMSDEDNILDNSLYINKTKSILQVHYIEDLKKVLKDYIL